MIHLFAWTFVFAINRSSKLSKAYLIYIGSIMGWLLMDLIGRIIFTDITPLYYLRIMSIFWLYLGIGMLNFIYVLLEKKYDPLFKYLAWLYPLSLIISLTTKMSVLPGVLFLPTLILGICVPSFYGIFLIIDRLRKTKNEILGFQLKLIITGIISVIVIGMATDVIPIFLGYKFDWRLGSAIACVQAFFILPALLKYHFIAFPVGEVAFSLFTNANEAIIAIDNNGIILRTNGKANQLFNIHPKNIQVKNIRDYIKDYDPEDKTINMETVLVENADIAINISQSNLHFGGNKQGKVMVIRDITERVQTAISLSESERSYRSLVEASNDIIYNIDLNGNFTFVNPIFEEKSGFKPEEVMGVNSNLLLRDDYKEKIQEIFSYFFKSKNYLKNNELTAEVPIIKKNGEELWVELGIRALVENKLITGFSIISRDITSRHFTQEKLKLKTEELESIFKALPDLFFRLDYEGTILDYQSGLEGDLLLPPDQFLGKKVMDIMPEDVAFTIEKGIKKTLSTQKLTTFQYKLTVDDETTYYEARLLPFQKNQIISIIQNITKKVKAENKIKESEKKLKVAQSVAKIGSFEYYFNDESVFWSDELYKIYGIDSNTTKASNNLFLNKILHPDDHDFVLNKITECLEKKLPMDYQHRIINSDGTEKTMQCNAITTYNSKGLPETIKGTSHDITEIKKYQYQLKDLSSHIQNLQEEERSHIAREIHDELGQNLTSINMDIEFLKNRGQEGADPDILKRLKALGKLVNDTIKTTRRISQELRPGILDDLGLKSAIEWQVAQYKKRSDSIYKLNLMGDDETLSTELATTIFRITQESLTNIVRHADATKVEINLNIDNPSIKLEIKDNGKGISENNSENNNASFGIFGMKERASILGGELKIVSRPKEGTSIIVELPIQSN